MTSTEITFESAGCTLAATYLEVTSPVAAAVLITGSGKTGRNPDVRLPFGQVLRADITGAVAEALAPMGKLGPGPFEGHVAGDLNHLLRPDPDCLGPRGYRRAGREPVSADVLTLITGWVARHFDGGPR